MIRSIDDLYIGTVVHSGAVRVSPSEVAAYFQNTSFALQNDPLSPEGSRRLRAKLSSSCPEPILIRQAIELFQSQAFMRSCQVSIRSVDRVRSYDDVAIGQPLDCVATVRFREQQMSGEIFVAMTFELRRKQGGSVLRFESGFEISRPRSRVSTRRPSFLELRAA